MTTNDFPEEGDALGGFRIGPRLGVGGMGVVHQALDTQLERMVALKIIAPHLSDDPSFRERFTREARAQASLDSPHVVQVYSSGEVDGRLYIASQLIPDGDLGRMLQEHGLPPTRVALHLLSQVADGLADAHAAGLVHRDIKPGNVLLRHRDHALTAYLADFGIARQVSAGDEDAGGAGPLTSAGTAVGTPSYMAPELHTGGEVGPLCDVYSLGCVLWATLSGSAPYAGGTDYQVVSGHVSGPVPQVEQTGPLAAEINRILRQALAKDPRHRHPSAVALRDDLKRVTRLPDDPRPVRPATAAAGAAVGAGAGGSGTPPSAPPVLPQPERQFYASRPPTPTPTPPPGPRSEAPPAPALAPGTVHRSAPAPAARGGASRRWVPVAVGAAVLAVATVVLVLVLQGTGDDDAGNAPAGGDAEVVEVVEVVEVAAVLS